MWVASYELFKYKAYKILGIQFCSILQQLFYNFRTCIVSCCLMKWSPLILCKIQEWDACSIRSSHCMIITEKSYICLPMNEVNLGNITLIYLPHFSSWGQLHVVATLPPPGDGLPSMPHEVGSNRAALQWIIHKYICTIRTIPWLIYLLLLDCANSLLHPLPGVS